MSADTEFHKLIMFSVQALSPSIFLNLLPINLIGQQTSRVIKDVETSLSMLSPALHNFTDLLKLKK